MEQRAVVCFLTLKSLNAKEIEVELINLYDHEALQTFAFKK
jgi:hypothetical protein